ncbi:VirD4-like conjugal transfer protein, CD1115 family [Exiguobacterium sp. s143]|uniref:VirD4-like conjugal transfer protein, CD1115 family n=2 Tax=unclassified Exiguobacterium TaxID=2644629 RepID=UPI001BEA86C0|nr:type IV secretory system conjugative DNA transfer family protein [Exiguobacterium sp. s143]
MRRSKRSEEKCLYFFNESVVIEIMLNFSLRSLVTSAWLWRCLAFLIALPTVLFLVLNVAFQLLQQTIQNLFQDGKLTTGSPLQYESSWWTTLAWSTSLAFVIFGVCFLLGGFLLLKYWLNFRDLKAAQKGSARFTTFQELKQQYRDVPDRKETYSGSGGVPVGRYRDRLYIDDSAVNNLVIGTTRSGKGETFVFSTIDLYSRAERQASLIINDPKGELFAASKETLEARGYQVEVLNLMNPSQSMSYNLLQLTIDAYLDENYSLAQQYARSVAYMLYHDPKAKDPFWSNSSTDLCTALILGLCEQAKHEPEKITMYNVALMLSDLGSRTIIDEMGQEQSALDAFFASFPENHPARMQYATLHFSGGQTRASILANTNAKLGIFTLDATARLTAQNSLDMKLIGFNRWIRGRALPLSRLTFYFPSGKQLALTTDDDGSFVLHHEENLEVDTNITVESEGQQYTVSLSGWRDETVGLFDWTTDAPIDIREIRQHPRPVAVFLIVPDYDPTLNVIASLYVKQVYTSLARVASQATSGRCERQVIFLLDEFGNMPAIEGMANIITVCLGRNIRFNLVIQSYAQLENLYGEDWKTIDGNCGNTHYLLTADESTAELISKKLGEQTIVTKSRSGQTFSLSKSKTESVDGRRLLTATEVMGLKEGEMLIIRVIKRQDKQQKRIQSYPLFLTGRTAMKYRYEYLADDFNTDRSINDLVIPCAHAHLDLNTLRVPFHLGASDASKTVETEEETLDATEWRVCDVLQPKILRSIFETTEYDTLPIDLFEQGILDKTIPVTDNQRHFLKTIISKRLEKLRHGV